MNKPTPKATNKSKPAASKPKPANPVAPGASPPARKLAFRHGRYKYDVCLSFAGENRAYVSRVARCLKNRGVVYFYDEDEKANLWGKNLVEHFSNLYGKQARYCVMFISKYYAEKVWPIHERRSAQERATFSKKEYILPAYFDNTCLPGIPRTVADVDLNTHTPLQTAKVIIAKLQIDQPDRRFKLKSESTPRQVASKPASAPTRRAASSKM